MNERRRDPEPELRVERVGAGRRGSWKLSAVTLVAALIGVAGFAVWGRSDEPPAVADVPMATAAPTPQAASPGTPDALPTTGPSPRPTLPPQGDPPPQTAISELRFGADAYAVIAQIDGRLYMDVLQEYRPGRFRGSFRVPFPSDPETPHQLEFAQIWTRDRAMRSFQVLATWNVSLGSLLAGEARSTELVEHVEAAQPNRRRAPRALRSGFAVHMTAESRYTFGVINVDVIFGERGARLVVDRDWPLRKDKDDLIALYRSFIYLER